MKIEEKLNYLFDNHYSEYVKAYNDAFDELSNQQSMFCVCGKLATGLHESHCTKFKQKVQSMVIEKLKHLLPNK